ncbi:MAG TPA: hypothetical protein VMF08_23335 [Candidatus Sulfotelmatobacter sp.]|nr:hypothetical protein [Candidatus Sulfotelmatobacter sp.]
MNRQMGEWKEELSERGCVEDQPQRVATFGAAAAGAPLPRTQPRSVCHSIMVVLLLAISAVRAPGADTVPQRWTEQKANDWWKQTGWLVGCNFIPSTAVNELEMWQADTYDPVTIDRELGLAQGLGFNCVRVFLHDIPWQEDHAGYLKRINGFLNLAHKHHIKVMFVLFDSCWNPNPQPGPQPLPRPFVHNSGWVQCPGADYMAHPERLDELKPYVQGIVGHFRNDKRIAFWDVYNEPGNMNGHSYGSQEPPNKRESALLLLQKTFVWAREEKPIQPLTSGMWEGDFDPAKFSAFDRLQVNQSDIITFHDYGNLEMEERCVQNLRRYGRPIICTEYMARPMGSTFNPILGWFKDNDVGAFNWGFVSGKTQTIYPWDSWDKTYTAEPPVWFHDIFHTDGTPYIAAEVQYIRSVTGVAAAKSN